MYRMCVCVCVFQLNDWCVELRQLQNDVHFSSFSLVFLSALIQHNTTRPVTRSDIQVYHQAISNHARRWIELLHDPTQLSVPCYQMLGHLMNNTSAHKQRERVGGIKEEEFIQKNECDERECAFFCLVFVCILVE